MAMRFNGLAVFLTPDGAVFLLPETPRFRQILLILSIVKNIPIAASGPLFWSYYWCLLLT